VRTRWVRSDLFANLAPNCGALAFVKARAHLPKMQLPTSDGGGADDGCRLINGALMEERAEAGEQIGRSA
jgi:hypothetical protein